tara:strand:+ start:2013 stop:2204 length:192 start_codon:yes stop_codon:yes gene_type:complete
MTRQDMLGCLGEDDGEQELETYINEIEEKFLAIRNLLDNIDIPNLDNITEASAIAADMSSDLY